MYCKTTVKVLKKLYTQLTGILPKINKRTPLSLPCKILKKQIL